MKVIQSPANTWDALMGEHVQDVVEEGFLNSEQLASQFGLSRNSARAKLIRLTSEGKLERRMFRIVTLGRTMPVAHYRPVNYEKQKPGKKHSNHW